jgi:predicted Ser/Thr protein kinase
MKNKVIQVNNIAIEDYQYILNMFYENTLYDKCEVIGVGGWSIVFGYKHYAIKHFQCQNVINKQDPIILTLLQDIKTFPKLYFYIAEQIMVSERVMGANINNVLRQNIQPVTQWLEVLESSLNQVVTKGYTPNDVHEENVIIDNNGIPRIVDVGAFIKNINMDLEEEAFCIKDTLYKLNYHYEKSKRVFESE